MRRMLDDAGVPRWQAVLARMAAAVAAVLVPQAVAAVERVAIAGSQALLARLEAAGLPPTATDTALDIVRGIERAHGEGEAPDRQWPSAMRAEHARASIGAWMRAEGGAPDAALINQTMEEAVARLRLEHAAVHERLRQRAG